MKDVKIQFDFVNRRLSTLEKENKVLKKEVFFLKGRVHLLEARMVKIRELTVLEY